MLIKLLIGFIAFTSDYITVDCQTTDPYDEVFTVPNNCPDPHELWPCLCFALESHYLRLSCSQISSESELERVFTNDVFPTETMFELALNVNPELQNLTRNVFGKVSFVSVFIGSSGLESVGESVFINSYSTLETWRIIDCNLSSQGGFPFDSLKLFTELRVVDFGYAGNFPVLPKITSQSIESLSILNCKIMQIEDQAFSNVTRLTFLDLSNNYIYTLPKDFVGQNSMLKRVHLYLNNVEELLEGAFRDFPELESIDFSQNRISYIERGAFYNLPKLRYLDLRINFLPYFLFEHLGVLPSLSQIFISNNEIKFIDRDLFLGCPVMTYVKAINMELTVIGPGTFDNLIRGNLYLGNNLLTSLDENWLRTVVENQNYVNLLSNPLECGCDMAWLFQDPLLLNSSDIEAQCWNGTDIQDLDNTFYTINC